MKIIALRTMFLSGKEIQKSGKPQDVNAADGDLAIRMGWATLPTVDKTQQEKKPTKEKAES